MLPTHFSFREIAERSFVSQNTVKTQAQSVHRKLGLSSRAEAVACARAAGLLDFHGEIHPCRVMRRSWAAPRLATMRFRGRLRRHRAQGAPVAPGGPAEGDFVEIEAGELTGVFAAPSWLRDVGLTSWLLVGVALLLMGLVWLASSPRPSSPP